MLSDILIAVGIGAVILGLIYAIFSSARTAQKGNAPVSEHAVSNKSSKKQQQKSDDEEESSVPAKKNNNNNTSTTTNTNNTKQRSTSPKKKSASPAGSSASSNNNNNTATKKADNKKADKKAAKKAREEEEAELDAIVEAEMKRSLATGIRKEKFEVINLDAVHKVKENKAARQEKKSEGASFNEKQIASEKAAGFRVVGAQEAAKKEAQQHTAATTKSSSPASRGEGKKNKSNNGGGGAMTREEELDLALRSVLSKRGGNKRGGDAGAFRPRREENSPEDERGFVELKGEIKASTPGGAWVRK